MNECFCVCVASRLPLQMNRNCEYKKKWNMESIEKCVCAYYFPIMCVHVCACICRYELSVHREIHRMRVNIHLYACLFVI